MSQLKFISLIFFISIAILAISFPLSAADNKNNYEQTDEKQISERKVNKKAKKDQKDDQSNYGSYKESDNKVDHHDTRDPNDD